MTRTLIISISILLCSCAEKGKKDTNDFIEINSPIETTRNNSDCDYLSYFNDKGNKIIDTFRLNGKLFDPIDDTINFKKSDFDFYLNGSSHVFIKTKTYGKCSDEMISIEYFKDLTEYIDLDTYNEIDGDRFFSSKNRLFFWWANSGGDFVIGIDSVDINSFVPSNSFCGGYDKNGVVYGSPNWGVYRLNIPNLDDFELIPKENNYWNTPEHFLISNNKVYDVFFDSRKNKRYFCQLNDSITIDDVLNLKK